MVQDFLTPEYTSPEWDTMLVVMGNDCIGSCNSTKCTIFDYCVLVPPCVSLCDLLLSSLSVVVKFEADNFQ